MGIYKISLHFLLMMMMMIYLFTLQQLLDLLIAHPSWTLAAPLTLSTETDCSSTGVLLSSARGVSTLHYYYSLYNLHIVAKLKPM